MSEGEIVKIRWKKDGPNLRREASAWLCLTFGHDGWSLCDVSVDTKGPHANGEGFYVATYWIEDHDTAFEFKLRFG